MKIKTAAEIQSEFFDIDREAKIAHIELGCDTPDDMFDTRYISKQPILSEDFKDTLIDSLRLVKRKYKIDLTVRFRDFGAYSEEGLHTLFRKNLEFGACAAEQVLHEFNVGWYMFGAGIVCFFLTMLLNLGWQKESVWKEILIYVADILTTVFFWEAVSLFFTGRRERRDTLREAARRFCAIHFVCGEQPREGGKAND